MRLLWDSSIEHVGWVLLISIREGPRMTVCMSGTLHDSVSAICQMLISCHSTACSASAIGQPCCSSKCQIPSLFHWQAFLLSIPFGNVLQFPLPPLDFVFDVHSLPRPLLVTLCVKYSSHSTHTSSCYFGLSLRHVVLTDAESFFGVCRHIHWMGSLVRAAIFFVLYQ